MNTIEKFLKEYEEAKANNPVEAQQIHIGLYFSRDENGRPIVRYTDGEQDITMPLKGKEHAYELATKAKAAADEQGKELVLEDGDGINAPIFSDRAWNEFYYSFIPKKQKIWA